MPEIIQFLGLNKLEEPEKEMVKNLSSEYHDKIRRLLKNITSIKVHIKEYDKSGHASKYSVNIKTTAPTRAFEVNKFDWDLARVVHKAFRALENEVKKYFRIEGSKSSNLERKPAPNRK